MVNNALFLTSYAGKVKTAPKINEERVVRLHPYRAHHKKPPGGGLNQAKYKIILQSFLACEI
jgi:hypothetical protein